jgi:hexosaminidase
LPLSIIPQPVSIRYGEGFFQCPGLPLLKGDECFHEEIQLAAGQLRQDWTGCPVFFDREKKPAHYQEVNCQKEELPDGVGNTRSEAYRLCITKDAVTVKAAAGAGAYHGLQTFRQLVLSEYRDGGVSPEHGITLPCCEITDYPRFSWRGFMLDSARHFYSLPFIKRLIDVLSLHHINRFHWHLTDDQGWRLPVEEYPLLTEIGSRRQERRLPGMPYSGGFYREDEIRELVDYAASRHIEVIPEVDLPGHASAILASYPGFGCTGGPYRVEERTGILENVLCAGSGRIFDLAAGVFNALARLFPSSYVHIGGDEVRFDNWKACPKCKRRLSELGLKRAEELQSWITLRLVNMLAERGKTAIGWDEVLEDSMQFKLPKETVVMSWRGSEGGKRASALGHPVIMCPNTGGCYLDYKHTDDAEEPGQAFVISPVAQSYSMDPVTPEMSAEEAARILGGQCNLWSELIYAGKIAEYMIFPRLCAIAEALWTPREGKDFEDFARRLPVHQKRLDSLGLLQYRGPLQ